MIVKSTQFSLWLQCILFDNKLSIYLSKSGKRYPLKGSQRVKKEAWKISSNDKPIFLISTDKWIIPHKNRKKTIFEINYSKNLRVKLECIRTEV